MRLERIEDAKRVDGAANVFAIILMIAALAWLAFSSYGCTPPALPAPVPIPAFEVEDAGGEGFAVIAFRFGEDAPTRIRWETEVDLLITEDDTIACVVLQASCQTSLGLITVRGAVPGSEPECIDKHGALGGGEMPAENAPF